MHDDGPYTPSPCATIRFELLQLRLCHVNFLPGLTLDSGHHIYPAASATKPPHNRAEPLHGANKRSFNGLTMADQFILMRVGWCRWWLGGRNGIALVSLIEIHFVSGRSETCIKKEKKKSLASKLTYETFNHDAWLDLSPPR